MENIVLIGGTASALFSLINLIGFFVFGGRIYEKMKMQQEINTKDVSQLKEKAEVEKDRGSKIEERLAGLESGMEQQKQVLNQVLTAVDMRKQIAEIGNDVAGIKKIYENSPLNKRS